MFLIDTPSAVNGAFVSGTPQVGQAATQVSPAWLNALQAEIAAVIIAAGLELDKEDSTQLLTAINGLLDPLASNTDLTALTNAVSDLQTTISALAPHVLQILDGKWVASGQYDAAHYAIADNSTKNRADYPAAWAKIQTSGLLAVDADDKLAKPWLYGPGDGTDTFQMPDWRSQFLRISSDGAPGLLGPTIGGFKANQNKAHTHDFSTHDSTANDGATAPEAPNKEFIRPAGETIYPISSSSSGGNEANPDHIGMRFVIRLK